MEGGRASVQQVAVYGRRERAKGWRKGLGRKQGRRKGPGWSEVGLGTVREGEGMSPKRVADAGWSPG